MGKQVSENKFDNPSRNRAFVNALVYKIINERKIFLFSSEGNLKISIEDEVDFREDTHTVTTLYRLIWQRVNREMRRQTPGNLGRIISTGQSPGNDEGATALCDIPDNYRLDQMSHGETLLVLNATATIIARMWDILVRKLAEEKQQVRLAKSTR